MIGLAVSQQPALKISSLSHDLSRGGCQGWTALAGGLSADGDPEPGLSCAVSLWWIFITVVYSLKWEGGEAGYMGSGSWIETLRRWFFKDRFKALLSTTVSKWRQAGGGRAEVIFLGTGGGTLGGSGLQGEPSPLDSSITRLSGP